MQHHVFWYFVAAGIIHPLWAMDPAGPADQSQAPIMEVEIVEIEYPLPDSAWREGKHGPGEASPALMKIRLERSPKPHLRGVITQTRESSFAEAPTADVACGSEGPILSRGASRILKLYNNGATQTEAPEPDISGLFTEPEAGAASAAGAPPVPSHREPLKLSELDIVNTEPEHSPNVALTLAGNRYVIASSSFLGGVLAAFLLKRK